MDEKHNVVVAHDREHIKDEEHAVAEGDALRTPSRGHGEMALISMRQDVPILRKLKAVEAWLDTKLGIETTGADRIAEDQRQPPSILNVGHVAAGLVELH
jgi:hypothetical protein